MFWGFFLEKKKHKNTNRLQGFLFVFDFVAHNYFIFNYFFCTFKLQGESNL